MENRNIEKQGSNPYVGDIIARVVSMLKMGHSLDSLRDSLALLTEIEAERRDKRVNKLMAEINYLTAVEYRKMNNHRQMREHARASIDLYKKCNISTLEDSVPILSELLPDYMHEGVVEARLLQERQDECSG